MMDLSLERVTSDFYIKQQRFEIPNEDLVDA